MLPDDNSAATPVTPNTATSAALTIAEKDKGSAERINSQVAEHMHDFSICLADINPTDLTSDESEQEMEQRGRLSFAVETMMRCELQVRAAWRKRDHARFELGEQLAGF